VITLDEECLNRIRSVWRRIAELVRPTAAGLARPIAAEIFRPMTADEDRDSNAVPRAVSRHSRHDGSRA